jgi:hypothetical protein
MGRRARWLVGVLLAVGCVGCVERRMLIVSDPPGATAFVNGKNVGVTPVSVAYDYYGDYNVMLVRDGYQTRTYQTRMRRPWFEFFPIDFFAENVWPVHVQDNQTVQLQMDPLFQPRTDEVLNSARQLRDRASGLNPPQ